MRRAERRGLTRRAVRNTKSPAGSSPTILSLHRGRHAKSWQDDPIPPERSAIMARIGPRNTAPELAVRRILHGLGVRFRLHRRDLPGTPDIVLPGRQLAILVHGCFWHRHPRCAFAYTPKTRVEFWTTKFKRNVARDRKVRRQLRHLGWRVHIIWECETRDLIALEHRLRKVLATST